MVKMNQQSRRSFSSNVSLDAHTHTPDGLLYLDHYSGR